MIGIKRNLTIAGLIVIFLLTSGLAYAKESDDVIFIDYSSNIEKNMTIDSKEIKLFELLKIDNESLESVLKLNNYYFRLKDSVDLMALDKNLKIEKDKVYELIYIDKMLDLKLEFTLEYKDKPSFFIDIEEGYWARADIYTLFDKGIVKGYIDNTFKPSNTISIPEFLVMLSRSLTKLDQNYLMPSINEIELEGLAQWAKVDASFVLSKMPQNFLLDFNTLNINRDITRQEVAYFIANSINFENKVYEITNEDVFNDLGPNSYFREIKVLFDNSIINGYSDGNYKPNNKITRAETSSVIARLLKNKED